MICARIAQHSLFFHPRVTGKANEPYGKLCDMINVYKRIINFHVTMGQPIFTSQRLVNPDTTHYQ